MLKLRFNRNSQKNIAHFLSNIFVASLNFCGAITCLNLWPGYYLRCSLRTNRILSVMRARDLDPMSFGIFCRAILCG